MNGISDRRIAHRPGWILLAATLGACTARDAAPEQDARITVAPDAVHALPPVDVVTRVVDVESTPDGRVWILNSGAPWFVVLGSDGRIEREFGDQGGGPEEFTRPVALVRGADPADLWAYDWGRNALIRISAEERREVALPRDSIPIPSLISFKGAGINPAPPWLERTSEGFLLGRARVTREESALHLWNADILLVHEDGRRDEYLPIADLLGDPSTRFGDASILIPYPLWTACADGTIAAYDPLGNALRRFSREGERSDSVALPAERRSTMTPDLVFEMFYRQFAEDRPAAQVPDKERMRSMTAEQNQDFVSHSAAAFPEYSDLRCTPDGSLWLRRFDAANGRLGQGSDWLRFSAEGSRNEIALPRSFRTHRIATDRIWGTYSDTLGVESVAWIDLGSLR